MRADSLRACAHVGQALAPGCSRAGHADAVVGDLQYQTRRLIIGLAYRPRLLARADPYAGGLRMPQHVGECFQQDALDLKHPVRCEAVQRGQFFVHLPIDRDARGGQPRL
ncbi:MAG: hypothetical protein A3F71_06550 [Burkholderiales bacterium RIFCSPLOWO2_12_FULL_64_33]|nr:MAG: hypothetical protein A3C40_20235 [Burkholderiales bacterium RIFCSPHIGHO2_02_FULL_64_19]OGB52290.1 MAG: hypothetical protein A3F71_06550 [Burkholderiales bacterium RIFCSPLOWO2_12_FULL_64_33]